MRAIRTVLIVGLAAISLSFLCRAALAQAQAEPPAEIQQKIEAYLRKLYAFGPEVKLVFSAPKETGVAGLLETTVELTMGENHDSAKMYVSKDGKFLFRGEMADLSKDPLAETRAKLDLRDAPSTGDPNAPVTIVEFADFECPVCRQLHDVLRSLLPNYPQARLVFKDFPIEQIHPWARTAALAGRCAYQQNPKAFWIFYDDLYSDQDLISAENVWTRVVDYAGQAGLDQGTFKACLASPAVNAAVDASLTNGRLLEVNSTPTLFINGRRLIGADAKLIEQYIQYELAQKKAAKK